MYSFKCKRCGECCWGEGGITISRDEVIEISRYLRLREEEFLKTYCIKKGEKSEIRISEDGFCIFYDKSKGCLIHPVKPKICRLWPFIPALIEDRDEWEMVKGACPGINKDATHEDFRRDAEEFLRSLNGSSP